MSDAAAREELLRRVGRLAVADVGVAIVIGVLASPFSCMAVLSGFHGVPEFPAVIPVLLWLAAGVFLAGGLSLKAHGRRSSLAIAAPLLAMTIMGVVWGLVHAGLSAWIVLVRTSAPRAIGPPGDTWLETLVIILMMLGLFFATILPFGVGLWHAWIWRRWRALIGG